MGYQRRVHGESQASRMSAEDEVKVAQEDSDESTDDDMPEMEEGEAGDGEGKGKQSRSEKKIAQGHAKTGHEACPRYYPRHRQEEQEHSLRNQEPRRVQDFFRQPQITCYLHRVWQG